MIGGLYFCFLNVFLLRLLNKVGWELLVCRKKKNKSKTSCSDLKSSEISGDPWIAASRNLEFWGCTVGKKRKMKESCFS